MGEGSTHLSASTQICVYPTIPHTAHHAPPAIGGQVTLTPPLSSKGGLDLYTQGGQVRVTHSCDPPCLQTPRQGG